MEPTVLRACAANTAGRREDDEYSMSDESIGASSALSVDDLTRLFEVKKVEDFGPDDAKNPRNMQQKKNLDD